MLYLSPMRALPILLLLGVAPLAGQTSRTWRPDDRVVIGDWTHVTAVAAGPERVFIVSPSAVLVWRPQFRRWEGPYDPPVSGYLAHVNAGMIDPLDNTLWLATTNGWIHFQAELQLWERGSAPGRVVDFAFDQSAPGAGLYLRTSDGWYTVPRGGFSPVASNPPVRPVRPATVNDAVSANPILRAGNASFLLDPALRSARLTAAARSFDNLGWYLGTDGVGTLFLTDGGAIPDRLSFGLPGGSAGAVMAVPGGVWVATDRDAGAPAGLTFVAGDLTEFQPMTGPAATGLPFTRVRRLIGVGSSIWAATDGGVIRFPTSEPAQYTAYTEGRGVPDRRVLSLASRRGVVVAATARGLARFADTTGAVAARRRVRRAGPRRGPWRRHGLGGDAERTEGGAAHRPRVVASAGARFLGGVQSGAVRHGLDGGYPRGSDVRPVSLEGAGGGPLVAVGADLVPPRSAPAAGGRRRWILGGGRSGGRLDPHQRGADPAPPRRERPPGRSTRPGGRRGFSLDRDQRRAGAIPPLGGAAMTDIPLGPGPEFDRVRAIAEALGAQASGLGNDCAILPPGFGEVVVSTDLSVEGVHFRREWLSLEEIGWRAAAAALSDLAATGAEVVGLTASVGSPPGGADRRPGAAHARGGGGGGLHRRPRARGRSRRLADLGGGRDGLRAGRPAGRAGGGACRRLGVGDRHAGRGARGTPGLGGGTDLPRRVLGRGSRARCRASPRAAGWPPTARTR